MKSKLVWVLLILLILQSGFIAYKFDFLKKSLLNPLVETSLSPTPKPLDKYSMENLKKRTYPGSLLEFGEIIKDDINFTSLLFYFTSDGKKVSGLANLPKIADSAPVIILLRGFVDQQIYQTGIGTRRVSEILAKNGFATLAPDFLGYGQSASPSAEPLEERFETYTTLLNLLSSIKYLNQSLTNKDLPVRINTEKIGLWGHSNGGHIALAILEISGGQYPTTLWAPVSKPFPYSILYYTDEYEDFGKKLRKVVAEFEKDYDVDKYSVTSYFDWIKAPMQLHQGGEDTAVPKLWSDNLYKTLTKLSKDVTYYSYSGEDHNFAKGGWNSVIQRDIAFFHKRFTR